ncbi:MAG: DUF1330 domain-containing protein [Phycisphaerae bacterium]|nr:DUF1330 domain-containing protein [Phycisphaerae bacterium]
MIIVLNLFDLVVGQETVYADYLDRVQPVLARHRAKVLFYGKARAIFKGSASQDYCGIIGYADMASLRAFSHDPEFVAIQDLRDASTTNYVLSVYEETGTDGALSIGPLD